MNPDLAFGSSIMGLDIMAPGCPIGHPYQAWSPAAALTLDINMVLGCSIDPDITMASSGSMDLCGPQWQHRP